MNNKTYANYLMHGRTKGSRNGISTTKGYTAVGQKAKGKLINGKYVYANNNENTQSGIVVKPASNNWQQQAALEQWKKQNQNAIAAKKKKAEAFDKASGAYRLGLSYPVNQMANRTRTVNEHYNKNWKNNTTINYDAPGSGSYLDAKKAKDTAYLKGRNAVNKATMNGANTNASQQTELERWKQQNRNNIAASKKAAAKQPTNIGASQQGDYARAGGEAVNRAVSGQTSRVRMKLTDAQENQAIAGMKAKSIRDMANTGASNDWQKQANTQRAMKEYMNKASDERKAAEKSKQKMASKQPSAINTSAYTGDPRYTRQMQDIHNREGKYLTSVGTNDKPKFAKSIALEKATHNAAIESSRRNSRSDIGNAIADAKEDAKNAFKALKKKLKKKK